ncbi:hypothetical protein GCM10011519_32970 [Marmoricola endophyticus]|uniref:N-acetyltransferase domain-containing protein n=1 Tax=Marmoricola endophyticus TaxID=2040280 RepID=A0A917BVP0_9ACTN|nr:hypothetical protein GCM10011519_32970 [Marmoricola endophyticus]
MGHATWPATYEPLLGAGYVSRGLETWWSHEAVLRGMTTSTTYVAEARGGVIGVAVVGKLDDEPMLWKLYVLPEHHGRGCGRALLERVIADLPAGAARLRLHVAAGNEHAQDFYRRQGFVAVGEVGSSDGSREIRMERPLAARPETTSESGLGEDGYSPVWADDDRPRIPRVADEREALAAYLDHYRATVQMKCRGLTAEQARSRPVAPSTMSAHGLVRHLAGVERWWFQQNFERRDVPFLFITADEPDLDFDPPADADFEADLATWRAECAVSREIVAAHGLDETARPLDWYEDVDLRWLVLRMIAEYAQHCGHLDLVREAIDGRTGS